VTQRECLLLPNLGAEEGDDWRGYRNQPATRVAARLWSHLFSRSTTLRTPSIEAGSKSTAFRDQSVEELWPSILGEAPNEPAYSWIESPGTIVPWFMSTTIAESIAESSDRDLRFVGPDPDVVARVHDKAFALEAARALDLVPKELSRLSDVLSASDLSEPDRVVERLSAKLALWPAWTKHRFTLKPRSGVSGRGRVAGVGVGEVDTMALRNALPRLAARGGAVFEPWLERRSDLSVCLHLPAHDAADVLPTLLGSLEMLATPSGVYRGHCGEIDNRGRVFSGHREDENLRSDAAALAAQAQRAGFFGACGVDAFTFVVTDVTDGEATGREIMRPAVEFNARPTMGLVALGLLRRALPRRRGELDLGPGDRRGFLLGLLGDDAARIAQEISQVAGALTQPMLLTNPEREAGAPQPYLFFARDLASLRAAYRERVGC
jgi:hypothetical protein